MAALTLELEILIVYEPKLSTLLLAELDGDWASKKMNLLP
jgi:hypothetical protein